MTRSVVRPYRPHPVRAADPRTRFLADLALPSGVLGRCFAPTALERRTA